MTTPFTPYCWGCAYFNRETGDTCKAFPKGIPNEVLEWVFDHREEVEGDGGLRFTLGDEDWGGGSDLPALMDDYFSGGSDE